MEAFYLAYSCYLTVSGPWFVNCRRVPYNDIIVPACKHVATILISIAYPMLITHITRP